MRDTAEVCGVAFNTVANLLDMAGKVCWLYHDEHVRGIEGRRNIQCDEVWSFIYAKKRNVPYALKPPPEAGDAWTFTALDAQSRLLVSYMVRSRRNTKSAKVLMDDLSGRTGQATEIDSGQPQSLPESDQEDLGNGEASFANQEGRRHGPQHGLRGAA